MGFVAPLIRSALALGAPVALLVLEGWVAETIVVALALAAFLLAREVSSRVLWNELQRRLQ